MNNVTPTSQNSPLTGLALKAQNDPRYMAVIVSAYQNQEGLTQQALLDYLQTNTAMLTRLSLCFRPDAKSPDFAQQVRQIARYTDIQPSLLIQMIRQVDSVTKLAELAATQSTEATAVAPTGQLRSAFAAARDRDEDEGKPDEQESDNKPS